MRTGLNCVLIRRGVLYRHRHMADIPQPSIQGNGVKIILGFFAGLILGALAVWSAFGFNAGQDATPDVQTQGTQKSAGTDGTSAAGRLIEKTGGEETAATQPPAGIFIIIEDQPAGLEVLVKSVSSQGKGWVVIHEDRGGVPGNALGAARFDEKRVVTEVPLLRGTSPARVYYGLLYRDDGDNIFSLERDFPLRNDSGDPIMVRFVTTN